MQFNKNITYLHPILCQLHRAANSNQTLNYCISMYFLIIIFWWCYFLLSNIIYKDWVQNFHGMLAKLWRLRPPSNIGSVSLFPVIISNNKIPYTSPIVDTSFPIAYSAAQKKYLIQESQWSYIQIKILKNESKKFCMFWIW